MSTEADAKLETLANALKALDDLGISRDSAAAAPALQYLLADQVSDPFQAVVPDSPGGTDARKDDPLLSAAQALGIKAAELKDIAEFGEAGVEPIIWYGRLPKSKSDRQRTLALLKLGLDKIGYGVDELAAGDMNRICATYECVDQNIPTNLQSKGLITRRGARGSYVYRLTLSGEDAVRDLIRGLVTEQVQA